MIDPRAIEIIKQFEGFEAEAYLDQLANPPVWTIGYGTTAAAGVGIVPAKGMTITKSEAEKYLARAIEKFADQIRPAMVRTPTSAQLGAMVSLAYNIGPGAFKGSSVLRLFNDGDRVAAADAFRLWNKAGGRVLNGLVRRREAERALFLSDEPVSAPPAAPTPIPAAPAASPSILASILAAIAALFRRS